MKIKRNVLDVKVYKQGLSFTKINKRMLVQNHNVNSEKSCKENRAVKVNKKLSLEKKNTNKCYLSFNS